MNNNTINLSCFIIPNSGVRLKYCIGYEQDIQLLKQIGVDATAETDCLQVWVHCPEDGLDNCSDHGFNARIIKMLGIENEEYYNQRAPNFFPMDILTSVHEREVREYTAPNGCKVRIKFEQLPYRYGRFGDINNVAKALVWKTKENNEWQEKMGHNRLTKNNQKEVAYA